MSRIYLTKTYLRVRFVSNKSKMIFAFLFLTRSEEYGLRPPFQLSSDNKIGYWEFGGSTVVMNDSIQIVPPIQFKKGCAWTNVEVPTKDWRISYDFKFSEGDNGAKVGLWITDKYADEGSLAGGPSVFKGVVVIISLEYREEKNYIDFYLIQNRGLQQINLENVKPVSSLEYRLSSIINVMLEVNLHTIDIKIGKLKTEKLIHAADLIVDISQNYIGITAITEQNCAKIELTDLYFSLLNNHEIRAKRKVAMIRWSSGSYTPNQIFHYRSPEFQKMYIEHIRLEEQPNASASFNTVIEVIDEANRVAYETASFYELNHFVRQVIVPYTTKWYQRTLKIADVVKSSHQVLNAGFNYTNSVLKTLNDTIIDNVERFSRKSSNLAELFSEVEDDFDINRLVKNSGNTTSQILFYIGISEFAMLIIILAFFMTRRGKKMLIQ